MVYPFFLITVVDLRWYYPRTVADGLTDSGFAEWSQRLRRLSRFYLLTAASIPLIGLGLLVLSTEIPRYFLMTTVITTAIGFGASFLAVQFIDDFVHDVGAFMVEPGSLR